MSAPRILDGSRIYWAPEPDEPEYPDEELGESYGTEADRDEWLAEQEYQSELDRRYL